MVRARVMIGAVLGVLLVGTGCGKPCEPIQGGDTVKKLGLVLDGGRLCKDEGSVATVDYTDIKGAALADKYKAKFSDWKAEAPDDRTLLLTRGTADTLFIITADKSKDRGVPFAIIRYCQDEECRKFLSDLAGAMGKNK